MPGALRAAERPRTPAAPPKMGGLAGRRQLSDGAWRLALLGLAVVAFLAAVCVSGWLFPLYSGNRDDSVYVAISRVLEHGHLTLPASDDLFRPWASAVRGDRIVFKYSPPWPAVLAAAHLLTGSTRVALGLTATATVVVMAVLAREVLRDRTAGVLAGALLALSPLFWMQSATYLPYVFQFLLGLCFAALLLTGARRRSAVRVASAGAVWGIAAFARPFDAVLFAAPFVLLVLLRRPDGARDGEGARWSRFGTLARLTAGALPVLAVMLAYDTVVLGGPFRLPYAVTGPQDGFGFGPRGVFPQSTIPFTRQDGIEGLAATVRAMPGWTFGGIVLVVLAVVGLARTRGPARWALAALVAVFPLGYLGFWGPYAMSHLWNGLQSLGPFYAMPVLAPLVTFGAAALVGLWRGAARWGRPVAALAVAACTGVTVAAVPAEVAADLAYRDDYRAVQRFVAARHLDHAVLLLPRRGNLGFISDTPFLQNDPSLDQPVLYAEDRAPEDFGLVDRFPSRRLYRLSEDLPPGATTGGRLTMDALHVDSGTTVTVRLRMTNPTDRPVAIAYLTDGHHVWTRTLDVASGRDRSYDVSWTVAAPGAPAPDGAARVDPSGGMLAMGIDLRGAGAAAGRPGQRWERRVGYRVVGSGTLLQLMRPGQGWTCVAPGAPWRPAAAGNPVADLAGG